MNRKFHMVEGPPGAIEAASVTMGPGYTVYELTGHDSARVVAAYTYDKQTAAMLRAAPAMLQMLKFLASEFPKGSEERAELKELINDAEGK